MDFAAVDDDGLVLERGRARAVDDADVCERDCRGVDADELARLLR